MNQIIFPEIQAAAEALASRITLTQSEIAEMKEAIKAKKSSVRAWQKAVAAIGPRQTAQKKRSNTKAQTTGN